MFSDRIIEMLFNEALRKVVMPVELLSSKPLELDFWDWADYFYCERN
jgi:hypothetical protein